MIRITTAITSSMWMKPDRVYPETKPSNQRMSSMTKMVQSISRPSSFPGRTKRPPVSLERISCQPTDYFLRPPAFFFSVRAAVDRAPLLGAFFAPWGTRLSTTSGRMVSPSVIT
jgi:hypothetical protein